MSRKKSFANEIRTGLDPVYGNNHVYKLINAIMLDGKKAVAENIVYEAFKIVEETLKKNPLEVFLDVIEMIRPAMEVRSRRIGGATYQIPVEVRSVRSYSLFMRWIKEESRKRKEKEMVLRLANEIMDAYNSQGGTYKRKENMQKMVDANRAFSHLKF
jgi:small subunit ribosomal protein S7